MRAYQNNKLPIIEQSSRFYNWCMRLLLERAGQWCADQAIKEFQEKRPIRLVLSQRGGHNYDKLFWYIFDKLGWQESAGTLFLKRPVLQGVLRRELTTVESHEALAGLQLADVIASAFFQAANSALSTFDLAPAKALGPIMARPRNGASKANFGVTLLPLPHQGQIPEADRGIFAHYGFNR